MMRSLSRYALILALSALSVGALGQPAPSTSSKAETPLSNSDVIKLNKLGLGDDVVIAKVNQAANVTFDLSTDGLVQLKSAGVSGAIITAMLSRTTPRQPASVPAPAYGPGAAPDANRYDIRLLVDQNEVRLPSNRGDLTTTGFWPVVMTFLDYPGLHARTRIKDPRPVVVIRTEHDPTSYYYLARLDVNGKEDNNRSLKIELDEDAFSASARIIPAGRWYVDCDVTEHNPGVWHVSPKRDLKPGEYGVVVPGGILYEFGID